MVFMLFLLTAIIFLVVDFILRKEDRAVKENAKGKKSPIFLSPERALLPLGNEQNRLFHLSHSWVFPYKSDYAYVGFDNFIPTLFSSEIKLSLHSSVGDFVHQGSPIWNVKLNGHEITQLSPVSGEIVDINPACKMDIPLLSDQVEKSWILKLKSAQLPEEPNNLMNFNQANLMNTFLRDELYASAQKSHYINDGGRIDPAFITNLSEEEWDGIVRKFFPFMKIGNQKEKR